MHDKDLDQYIAEYGGIVRTVCRGILPGRLEDCEEAQADTFLKLWRCKALPQEELHLRNYVIRIARSCAIDKYRSLVRRGVTFPIDEREDAALSVELVSEMESQELIEMIQSLPPPDGELFLRHYLYGEPTSMLAEYFGLVDNTVRTKLHRAKGKLQMLLRKDGMI